MSAKRILFFAIVPLCASVVGLITLQIVAWIFSLEDVARLTVFKVTAR